MTTALSVNLNAVALLRNRRNLPWPSIDKLGCIALAAGADGLTVHPRPDERHIRFSDLPILQEAIGEFPGTEFNIEGYPTEVFLDLCRRFLPEQVTLVPDTPSQTTSDHGWNLIREKEFLFATIAELKQLGIRASVFVDGDGDEKNMEVAKEIGADRIELYTGPYGECFNDLRRATSILERLGRNADAAHSLGLAVNAGHDLTVANLPRLIERIPYLTEVSIGHELIADALEYGMAETVRRFRRACGQSI